MKRPLHYSGLSRLNHWLTALLVTAMLVLGFAAAGAPGDDTESYLMSLHIGLGFFVFLVVIWRVAYRLYEGFKANTAATAPERWLAWAVHRLLLLALVLQVITGPLYLFTEGEGVDVFGWFTVYIPLQFLSAIHEPAEVVHVISGLYLIPGLIVLHFLGAARHYLADQQQRRPMEL
ncbi:MAG TPA: cytochrome b/b6 domain-containing protein [Alcanivorax sp.]|nr:cytochrome b/b6 domain-containing protein [Alcanivorax sp.]